MKKLAAFLLLPMTWLAVLAIVGASLITAGVLFLVNVGAGMIVAGLFLLALANLIRKGLN